MNKTFSKIAVGLALCAACLSAPAATTNVSNGYQVYNFTATDLGIDHVSALGVSNVASTIVIPLNTHDEVGVYTLGNLAASEAGFPAQRWLFGISAYPSNYFTGGGSTTNSPFSLSVGSSGTTAMPGATNFYVGSVGGWFALQSIYNASTNSHDLTNLSLSIVIKDKRHGNF